MSDSARNTADNVEFATFEANRATDQFRVFAEKGVEQSKEAFARMKHGADGAQKAFEASFESARAVSNELSLKSLAAMRASTDLTFSHMEALLGVKSISDFAELQTSFMRKQVELAVNQVEDVQTVSSRGAEDVAKPVKDIVERAWSDLKVA
ncbi:phasin [Tianweitania sp. BSSL-BM11]|uniref:Phasin n=1 Tax=Tianweitania aestuarii TaxID=2814886 RepID=A0ABS5RR13_9HYPH|nr:phasin [Tianweitania aestuarii]MBS9719441.1 phasin [Tianweitania aestuarii]